MASTTLDIIRGLAQAAANAYDGTHVESYTHDERAREVGLKREEGHPILDKRVMDGFKVSFSGSKMKLCYQSEISLKEVHGNGFEDDINSMLKGILSFLKKEYKAVTGDTVSLSPIGEEADIMVQSTSRRRSWVQAYRYYKIGGINGVDDLDEQESKDRLDDTFKKWLELGKKAKKPENVTRKEA